MSDVSLFERHPERDQAACDKRAEELLGSAVRPLDWQGHFSYTVESTDQKFIIQFRSEGSRLDPDIYELARRVHGPLVPWATFIGRMDSLLTIWKAEKIPGVGFLLMIHDEAIKQKLLRTMNDLACFYAGAWKMPQPITPERRAELHQEYDLKLTQMSQALPPDLQTNTESTREKLGEILDLPWALTHDDLGAMYVLLDPASGSLQGVVDWAEASVLPFGIGLYGIENLLGYINDAGWNWLVEDVRAYQQVFRDRFVEEVGGLPASTQTTIEAARVLGLLFRHGFVWNDRDHSALKEGLSRLGTFLPYSVFA